MITHCRCAQCRARKKLPRNPDSYRLQPRCSCGARDWRKDSYRHRVELPEIKQGKGRYSRCYMCFHWPHRIGSTGCIYNADGSYRLIEETPFDRTGAVEI